MSAHDAIQHALLAACGVAHGFGVRGAPAPPGCVRPRQVHGIAVMQARSDAGAGLEAADAIVSDIPALPVAVVTADCVPLLIAEQDGRRVAAVHAGWRGLAAGVVEKGLRALLERGARADRLRAVVGPRIGVCCYEVDAPVIDALADRFGADVEAALRPSRAGHAMLDLAALVRVDCLRAGLTPDAIVVLDAACTHCDPVRFHSHRRDGARAGRLLHFIAASGTRAA